MLAFFIFRLLLIATMWKITKCGCALCQKWKWENNTFFLSVLQKDVCYPIVHAVFLNIHLYNAFLSFIQAGQLPWPTGSVPRSSAAARPLTAVASCPQWTSRDGLPLAGRTCSIPGTPGWRGCTWTLGRGSAATPSSGTPACGRGRRAGPTSCHPGTSPRHCALTTAMEMESVMEVSLAKKKGEEYKKSVLHAYAYLVVVIVMKYHSFMHEWFLSHICYSSIIILSTSGNDDVLFSHGQGIGRDSKFWRGSKIRSTLCGLIRFPPVPVLVPRPLKCFTLIEINQEMFETFICGYQVTGLIFSFAFFTSSANEFPVV